MSTAAYTALSRADAEVPSDGQPRPSETSGDAAAGAPTAALDADELASETPLPPWVAWASARAPRLGLFDGAFP